MEIKIAKDKEIIKAQAIALQARDNLKKAEYEIYRLKAEIERLKAELAKAQAKAQA